MLRRIPGCEGALMEHSTDDGLIRMDIGIPLAGNTKRRLDAANTPFDPEGGRRRTRRSPAASAAILPPASVTPAGVALQGIAIEVDGPTHFLKSHPGELDASSQVLGVTTMKCGCTCPSPLARWKYYFAIQVNPYVEYSFRRFP